MTYEEVVRKKWILQHPGNCSPSAFPCFGMYVVAILSMVCVRAVCVCVCVRERERAREREREDREIQRATERE